MAVLLPPRGPASTPGRDGCGVPLAQQQLHAGRMCVPCCLTTMTATPSTCIRSLRKHTEVGFAERGEVWSRSCLRGGVCRA